MYEGIEKCLQKAKGTKSLQIIYRRNHELNERIAEMKKSRFGRMIIMVLTVVTVFAFSATALAWEGNATISASSTTSQIKLNWIGRTTQSWAARPGSSFSGSSSTVRLTVRPYEHGTSTRLSLAKTFSPSVQSGGQAYDVRADGIDVKANSSENGVWCGVTGSWYF